MVKPDKQEEHISIKYFKVLLTTTLTISERKTNKKKFSKKLKEIHRKIGETRTMRTKDIVKKLNEILVGYFHYYGISDNSRSIKAFRV